MKFPIKGRQYKGAPQNTLTYPSLPAKNLFRYSFHISGKPETNFFLNHDGNARGRYTAVRPPKQKELE